MKGLVLSLFPGLGLLDRAFEEAGFCIVRGPDALWGGDVRAFHPPPAAFAGIIGGPPCQTFSSLANLVRAKGGETRFGNLIPEFERVVREAWPAWFLMENVPAAPVPVVDGYAVRDFVVCNSHIAGDDGFGQEQMRKRRFSFGLRGAEAAPDLRRWIKPAALLLPAGDARETPVKLGGSGKVKRSRQVAVLGDPGTGLGARSERVKRERQPAVRSGAGLQPTADFERSRIGAVPGGGAELHHHDGILSHGARRSIAEMARLQGLPEDFLADAPFTIDGKRKAIANGVPLPLGRAIAQAVAAALDLGMIAASVDVPEVAGG